MMGWEEFSSGNCAKNHFERLKRSDISGATWQNYVANNHPVANPTFFRYRHSTE